ncbi:MAG: hypothetical protein AB1505_37065, partial [Candidatus Latescibacterota bacterium]
AARLFRIERVNEWSGTVTLTGDVTIPAGTSLTIAAGTEVRVLTGDDLAGGTYPDRTEIIGAGTHGKALNAPGGVQMHLISRLSFRSIAVPNGAHLVSGMPAAVAGNSASRAAPPGSGAWQRA